MKSVFTCVALVYLLSACSHQFQGKNKSTSKQKDNQEEVDPAKKNNDEESTAVADVDGKKFCRTVVSDGSFGQPADERQHCVSFENGIMTDDADTFFGNPPESLPYKIEGEKILVERDGEWVNAYTIKGSSIENDAGAILKEES